MSQWGSFTKKGSKTAKQQNQTKYRPVLTRYHCRRSSLPTWRFSQLTGSSFRTGSQHKIRCFERSLIEMRVVASNVCPTSGLHGRCFGTKYVAVTHRFHRRYNHFGGQTMELNGALLELSWDNQSTEIRNIHTHKKKNRVLSSDYTLNYIHIPSIHLHNVRPPQL